jgi:hypothetical protein
MRSSRIAFLVLRKQARSLLLLKLVITFGSCFMMGTKPEGWVPRIFGGSGAGGGGESKM